MLEEKHLEANRDLWNQKTKVHKTSAFYDVEGFKKGDTSLRDIELGLFGDLSGKSVLHLQCHFGLDSMSMARQGAHVTAVDFSPEAIRTAREINDEVGTNCTFIESNIYDLPNHLDQEFDIVFTSYGTIYWLPDLISWGQIVNRYLKPGGRFIIVEFHPFLWTFDDPVEKITYSYFNHGVIEYKAEGTYTDRDADIEADCFSWNHSLGEIYGALTENGLKVETFKEYDFSPYDIFEHSEQVGDQQYVVQQYGRKIPLIFSMTATK